MGISWGELLLDSFDQLRRRMHQAARGYCRWPEVLRKTLDNGSLGYLGEVARSDYGNGDVLGSAAVASEPISCSR